MRACELQSEQILSSLVSLIVPSALPKISQLFDLFCSQLCQQLNFMTIEINLKIKPNPTPRFFTENKQWLSVWRKVVCSLPAALV